jgi:hypothetical protein
MLSAQQSQQRHPFAQQHRTDSNGNRLPTDALIAATLVTLVLMWFHLVNPYGKDPARLWLATSIIVIGLAPLLLWMCNPRRCQLPIFQLHLTFYVLSFGFAGLLEDKSTLGTQVEEPFMQEGQCAVLLGLSGLFAGFYLIGPFLAKRLSPCRSLVPLRSADLGWVALGLYPVIRVVSSTTSIEDNQQLNQSFQGLGDFCFWFLAAGFMAGVLRGLGRLLWLWLYLPLLFLTWLGAGVMAVFIAIFVCILYMSIVRKVPWFALGVIVACTVILQPVKFAFRSATWGQQTRTGRLDRVRMFLNLGVEHIVDQSGGLLDTETEGLEMTMARMNHLHVTGAIIRDTPSLQPFQNGRTYLPLLTKWIPRVIWRNKPIESLGNEWAQRYSYLDQGDDMTSFVLPWLSEMFINFGWAGVFWISLAVGFGFHVLHRLFFDRPSDLSGCAFGMILATNLIFAEGNASLQIGHLMILIILFAALGSILRAIRPDGPSELAPAGSGSRFPGIMGSGQSERSGNHFKTEE